VLRSTTERPEGVDAGTLKLAGTGEEDIYSLAKELLTSPEARQAMSKASNPYGDGQASARIVEAIRYHYGYRPDRPQSFSAY
jgi:UDP-N-acetylglucosamine 2-epimerase (non-hydrolysing)